MPDRVLIVGAGPTGLAAALELSRLGIAVRIIDKQAAPPTTSRAVGVQARTLELLELRGLADEMVRIGNPGLAASFYGGGKRGYPLAGATRLHADRQPLSLPPVHFAGRDRAYPAHGGREAGGPDRARRRTRWAGAGRALLRTEPGEGRAAPRRRPAGAGASVLAHQRRGRAQHRAGHPRPSVRGEDPRRAVRPGRPAHRWRTRRDRSPRILLRTRLPGPVPHGQPALPPDGQQPAQPAQQGHGTGARGAASDLRPALAHPGAVPGHELELLVPHQQPDGGALKVGRLLLGGDSAHIHSPAGLRA